MLQAPLPSFDGDTQLLRQMFATLTTTDRDINGARLDLGTLRTDMQAVRHVVQATQNFASTVSSGTLALYRAVDTVNDRLSLYAGRGDGIQMHTTEMWDRLGSLETDVMR